MLGNYSSEVHMLKTVTEAGTAATAGPNTHAGSASPAVLETVLPL